MNHAIESLPILVLDVYGRCNCRCVMCDIWKRTAVRRLTPHDLACQLPAIDRLNVRWVVLTGGEPLMHPELFQLCAPLKDRGIRVTLLTTGLLLERFAESVVTFIDDVIVSVDGPPEIHDRIRRVPDALERTAAGIRAMRSQRYAFPVSARSVVQHLNCAHLRSTVESARAAGCDRISFLAVDLHSSAFDHDQPGNSEDVRLTRADLESLAREVDALIDSGECGRFIAETPAKLRRIVEQSGWASGTCDPVSPPCNAPWVSAVIEPRGSVRPCFFHRPIGTVASGTPLDRVLNSDEAVSFRRGLDIRSNPICRRCVCSLQYGESVEIA